MKSFIAVDIETTGLDVETDSIIEVGAAKFSDGKIVDTYSSLIRTEQKISSFIEQLTGITNEMLAVAPDAEQVKTDLLNFCGQEPLVFHNASFDVTFLERFYGKPIENNFLDTLEITKILYPVLPSYDLRSLAAYFELITPTHRALDDAIACGNLLIQNLYMMDKLKPQVLSLLSHFLKHPKSLLGSLIEQKYYQKAWESKIELKDFQLNSIIPEPTYLKKSAAGKQLIIDEFKLEEIDDLIFQSNSCLNNYPNFELRTGQIAMLKQVCKAFLEDRLFVAEAATGTGKSLAYLLPAALWSALNKEKVVISTHTINLQEQLSNKDLPIIKKILGLDDLASTIIKGRNNYLCLKKLQSQYNNAPQNNLKQNYFFSRIISWLATTGSGDKSELNLKKMDHEHWLSVAADSYSCLGSKCEFYSSCFVTNARRKAEQADILITNHSLLLSDVKTDSGVLPSYKYLIIDEAHNLEQESINHLTIECSSFLFYTLFKHLKQGLEHFSNALKKFKKKDYSMHYEDLSALEECRNRASQNLVDLQQAFDDLKAAINNLHQALEKEREHNQAKWLKNNIAEKEEWQTVCNVAQNLIFRLQNLSLDFSELANKIKDIEELSFSLNISFYQQLCGEYAANLAQILNLDQEDMVVWLETAQDGNFSLKQAPLEVGKLLFEKIYQDKHSVIFTSATLTIENDFSFFNKQVGLDLVQDDRLQTEIYQAPFDYEKQALLCIPTDLPSPKDDLYDSAINKAVEQLVTANQGRALVLFTSYQQLYNCYYSLKDPLKKENITLLAHQIDGNRSSVIEQFKREARAVLLGTNSFWEGIDIPGDSLTLLIIVRLPFQAPGIPTVAAKMEYLRKNNQDPFNNLSLPQAIIRFKQGFGRLVRSQQDSGLVVVLDKRIIKKNYGRKFLNSLPVKTHYRGTLEEIVQLTLNKNQGQINSVI